jgi:hypothetical protein
MFAVWGGSFQITDAHDTNTTQGCIRQHLVHTTDSTVTVGESHEPDSYVSVLYAFVTAVLMTYQSLQTPRQSTTQRCRQLQRETGRQANKQN